MQKIPLHTARHQGIVKISINNLTTQLIKSKYLKQKGIASSYDRMTVKG
ncbi:MAG: hypothetical protein J0H76_13710 [Sphingobacteriales bacterium]|nr:hypothetical protein [Sphingobacteriales bacterium]